MISLTYLPYHITTVGVVAERSHSIIISPARFLFPQALPSSYLTVNAVGDVPTKAVDGLPTSKFSVVDCVFA